MKIVYCTDTISQMGGIEIVTIAKANALAAIPGNQVWIAVSDNKQPSIMSLKNVKVLDLAVHYFEEDAKGYWHAFFDYWKKQRFHRQRLELVLNEINPDVVITTGKDTRRILPKLKIKSNPVFIRELHSSRHYGLHQAQGWLTWAIVKIGEIYEYGLLIRKYDKIVVLTKADKSGSWKNWDKVVVMPNPLIKQEKEISNGTSKVAVSAARLFRTKNYESLVNIWAKVILRHPDWRLQIWGEGPEEGHLREQISRMGLKNHVFLMGYTSEVQEQMAKASIFVLTSLTEGFSLVTIEAMSVGIPAVVYNCPGGICHVVKDGETGYLVPMNDEDAFVEKICALIENDELRKKMGKACLQEVEQYRMESIVQRWMELFQDLLAKKRKRK